MAITINNTSVNQFTLFDVTSKCVYIKDVGVLHGDITLAEKEENSLRTLICKGARSETREAFERAVKCNFENLPCLSILRNVMCNSGSFKLCAGQDYSVDLAEIRKIFRNS